MIYILKIFVKWIFKVEELSKYKWKEEKLLKKLLNSKILIFVYKILF